MSDENYTDAEWIALKITNASNRIVEAIEGLKRPEKHFSDWTVEELMVLAPADRVALAMKLCEGTSAKVISR